MLTDYAKMILHHLFCCGCMLVIITVFVMWAVGMEPQEFWRW